MITYDSESDTFRYLDNVITLDNPDFFEDLSFTLSYSPLYNAFISFHDYFPDWVISTEKDLFMFKGKGIWRHSVDKVYSEFFGHKKPFEIEFVNSNKMQVQTISSIEYYLECLIYRDDEINQYHLKDENFDNLILYNTEQCSGVCKMIKTTNPYQEILYPKFNGKEMEVLFSKVENKYRVNQFKDLVKDRENPTHVMFTKANGWQRLPNPVAIDYTKSSKERKLFRHYDTRVLLQKESPNSLMIIKLNLTKGIISPR
jgi:hypothetical protein